jgi:hypothetical protein
VISLLANLNARNHQHVAVHGSRAAGGFDTVQFATMEFSPRQRKDSDEANASGQGFSGFLRSLHTINRGPGHSVLESHSRDLEAGPHPAISSAVGFIPASQASEK